MSQPVAFFDIDGTVFRSSLLVELVESLIGAELFPATATREYEAAFVAWQSRQGSYEAYIASIISTFLAHIEGIDYRDFAAIGEQVVAEKGQHVYRFTRDYIRNLKDEGYALIAISQSPKTILDNFCRDYGFDKVYGRMYELGPQNRFTGEVIHEPIIENKANIVKRVFERHPEYTPAGSIAVGDTDGDIPLLASVEQPLCFNPNQVLYDYAKAQGWPIVVERKDVVYHL